MELGDDLKLKLEAIGNAQSLSRYVVVTGMVLAFTFTLSAWNAYLSWDRILVTHWEISAEKTAASTKEPKTSQSGQPASPASPPAAQEHRDISAMLRQEHSKQWLESRNITLQPIGVRIGIHDIVPVCTLVMLTVSIWIYFSLAREFSIIRSIMSLKYSPQETIVVLSAITDQSVFYRIARSAPPHRKAIVAMRRRWATWLAESLRKLGLPSRVCQRIARRVFLPSNGCEFLRWPSDWTIPWLVTFTPFITIVLVFVGDIMSIYQKDVFDGDRNLMVELIRQDPRLCLWLAIFYSLSLVLAYSCWRMCQASCRYFLLCEKCLAKLKQRQSNSHTPRHNPG